MMRRQLVEEPEPMLLRGGEVSHLLGVSRAKAYRMMQRRELPVVTLGKSIRVPRGALEVEIRLRTEGGSPEAR